jgi:hypothetical protein
MEADEMVNRMLLRWGVFLLGVGGVLLLAQGGQLDRELVRDSLGLWPLMLIGFGAAILLRRTRLAIPATVLAAVIPGLLIGGAVVAAPEIPTDCRLDRGAPTQFHQGPFNGEAGSPNGPLARADLHVVCGRLTVAVIPGTSWDVTVNDSGDRSPRIFSDPNLLRVASLDRTTGFWTRGDGDAISVRLPDGRTIDLVVDVDAGVGTLDLRGARLGALDLRLNAGAVNADLARAELRRLVAEINAGSAKVIVPAADFDGELTVNAGKLELCVPDDLGVRIRSDITLGSLDHTGLVRNGSAWESTNYPITTRHADLAITVNVGSVEINPEGDCR